MNLRRDFEKLIEKKKAEIEDLRRSVFAAEAYIQAMNDALKKIPRDDPASGSPVRAGSDVEKIRDVIIKAGKPLHLSEIITALGRPDDASTKAKLAGLLGWYISQQKVFIKTAPNTYGLLESPPVIDEPPGLDLPPEFGAGRGLE